MSKEEELCLVFAKTVKGENTFFGINASNASEPNKNLALISFIPTDLLEILIADIRLMQEGTVVKEGFLTEADEFQFLEIEFHFPYYHFSGFQVIHMDDMQELLLEWLAFVYLN